MVLLSKKNYFFEEIIIQFILFIKIDVIELTKVIFMLHQEDENSKGVKQLRPYLDISLAIFRRTKNDGLVLVQLTPF